MKKWHTGSVRVWQAMGAGTLVTWVAVSCSSPDRRFSQGEGGEDSLGGNSGTGAGHSGRGGVSGSAGRRDDTAGEAPVPDPDGGSSGSSGSDDASGSGGVLDMAGAGGDSATTGGTSGTAGSETSAGAGGTLNASGSGGKAGGSGAGGAGDVTPPSVVSVTPTGTGVVKSASIVVKFSESMKASAASSVTLSSGGAEVALGAGLWSANDTTLTLQPTSELAYAIGEDPLTAMSFTISVQTSARDAAGNALAAAYTSSFSTLRRLQTLVTATEQTGYFAAESDYGWGAGTTFNVIRQVGGGGWEDQYTYGLVGFPKTNTTLTGAPANAESVALELYAGNALS